MKVKSEGLNEILNNLDRTKSEARKLGERAVRNISKDVAETLSNNTPYDSSSDNPSHLKDNVMVSMKKTKDESYKLGYVTYRRNGKGRNNPRDVLWRVKFVEWGTIHQKPQGMVLKTAKQVEKSVASKLESEMRRLL